jgi:hypothetical protein
MLIPTTNQIRAESAEAARARIKSLAAKYTKAMGEIERVANLNLNSKQALRDALTIFKRNDPDLRYLTYRLIEIATNNQALQKGAEDKLRAFLALSPTVQDKIKKANAEPGKKVRIDVTQEFQAWVNDLKKNPSLIRDWPGVSQTGQDIRNQIAKDKAALRKVAANLKRGVESTKKSASLTGGPEDSGATLWPIPVAFNNHSGSISSVLVSQGWEEVVAGVIIFAVVSALVITLAVTISACLTNVKGDGTWSQVACGYNEVDVPPGPSEYEQCKAECDKWREDCIALARRVGNEDDEAMCWYRYYDDCLWSSCERLR